ncbi:MAG: YwiC-like family protein [Terracidiphilus sp.]
MATESAVIGNVRPQKQNTWFFPREHGATAMLFTPIVCAAVLSRAWRWSELATLTAAFAALAAKDPMVVLARQRLVWKQWRSETAAAIRWFAGWSVLLAISGMVLLFTWPFTATLLLGLGVAAFSALAIAINVKNRQRSTMFQIASAFALTSSALATSLSATGTIALWCWWLWLLLALQAAAAILVVHARLDARIALRTTEPARENYRRAAQISIVVLVCAAAGSVVFHRGFAALALSIAALGYAYDLHRQRNAQSLQLPLKAVGQQALALSSLYAILLIAGLW